MAENYMQDQNVRGYYDRWIHRETLIDHASDRERFYKFVKACVDYAGHKNLRRKLDTSILRLSLYDDLHSRYSEKAYDDITHEIVVLFEEVRDYEDTPFP